MVVDPAQRPKDVQTLKELLSVYKNVSFNRVRRNIVDITSQFNVHGSLSSEYINDFSLHLQTYNEYGQGGWTYNNYFKPLLDIRPELVAFWSRYADNYSIQKFVQNYCNQLIRINRQTGWSFKSMVGLGDFILHVFRNCSILDAKIIIFRAIILCRDGFGELSGHLKELMTNEYSYDDIPVLDAL